MELSDRVKEIYANLEKMRLHQDPFILVSMIGQELLSAGFFSNAITALEAALCLEANSLRLRGSVFSALSTAYWAQGETDKAIACMQQDLAIVRGQGECTQDLVIIEGKSECTHEDLAIVEG